MLPPRYKRDAATGRFTGEVERELSESERRVLKADPLEKDQILLKRVERHWFKQGTKDDGGDDNDNTNITDSDAIADELDRIGARVRSKDMSLNVLGRSPKAQSSSERFDDGTELGRDVETGGGFSHNLTQSEFRSFQKYVKKRYKIDVTEDDIPVEQQGTSSTEEKTRGDDAEQDGAGDPDDPELALKWLTSRAQRQMDDVLDDNPFADLMPSDLAPSRLVNRKRAKPIPTKLLHHNNVELLQHFLTPTGQIRNRVQTRLGARDQRRIARLVKRARALGLIPYSGQFKTERHGWMYDDDIDEDREWEKELAARGLVIIPNGKSGSEDGATSS